MFTAQQHPHLSAAVRHLRGWITILALIVAACCLSQMLIYGFARYTEIRFKQVEAAPTPDHALKVVASDDAPPASESPAAEPKAVGGVRALAIEHGREVGPQKVHSSADAAMSRISLFACGAGSLACVMLCILTLLGTVIAGGGNIPGVERTVTASTWSLVLGLIALPWASAFPHLRIPGIFASYRELCAVADGLAGAASPTAALFQWIVMPLAAAVLSMVVLGLFRSGVERGIIATSVTQFDAAIQKEMTDMARRGVAHGGRALGALNRAVGSTSGGLPGMPPPSAVPPAAAPMQVIAPIAAAPVAPIAPANVETALEQAAAVATSLVRETQQAAGATGRSVADPAFRRLI